MHSLKEGPPHETLLPRTEKNLSPVKSTLGPTETKPKMDWHWYGKRVKENYLCIKFLII